jgi:hypothetical protein
VIAIVRVDDASTMMMSMMAIDVDQSPSFAGRDGLELLRPARL